MPIFAVIAQPSQATSRVGQAVEEKFPNSHMSIGNKVWLVDSSGTAQDVSNVLEVTDGTNGAAVILQVSAYYGRANPSIWEWIKAHWGAF